MRKGMLILSTVVLVVASSWVATAQAEERTQRKSKVKGIQFFKASATEASGYQSVNLDDGSTLFVSRRPAFANNAATVSTSNTTRGSTLILSLSDEARAQLTDTDQLAIYNNDQFIASTTISNITDDGRISITGLSTQQISMITKMMQRNKAILSGAIISVVSRLSTARAGDLITVDMYLSGAKSVRAFQVMLEVAGGDSGTISRDQMIIDINREDFIFSGVAEIIKGEDQVRGRIGGVKIYGPAELDVNKTVYLGSQTFNVSDDASGTFQFIIRKTDSMVTADVGVSYPYTSINSSITIN